MDATGGVSGCPKRRSTRTSKLFLSIDFGNYDVGEVYNSLKPVNKGEISNIDVIFSRRNLFIFGSK